MSCHVSDSGKTFICLSPILGLTSEEQWIADEIRLFARNWIIVNGKRVPVKITSEQGGTDNENN